MQEDAQEMRSAREAELFEVLSSYVEPRAVSYRFVIGFVLIGLFGCVSVAWAASQAKLQVPLRFEPEAEERFLRGIAAFERGEWDESERLLTAARDSGQVSSARLYDYLERLALLRRDSERLLRAEEALEEDEPERALALTAFIAPNSALFAQAEVLSRAARARAGELAAKKRAAELDAEAARQASRVAAARAYTATPTPTPTMEPPRKVKRKTGRPAADLSRGVDADW